MKKTIVLLAVLFLACPVPKPEPIVPMLVKRFEFCGFDGNALRMTPVKIKQTSDKTFVIFWNPNQEIDLAGYRVYWGKNDVRENMQDVGLDTEKVLSFVDGEYMAAVSAYDTAGNESPLSEIVRLADTSPVVIDSLIDSFNVGQYPNENKWVIANNSIGIIKLVDGVVQFNSNDFVSAWMRSKDALPLGEHVAQIGIAKSSGDFALGLSSSYDMNASNGFFNNQVVRFYIASVQDTNKRELYYVERLAGKTTKEKLLIQDTRLKDTPIWWRIGFAGDDSVRWEYCLDGETQWHEIHRDRHQFSNVDKLWIELAAYDTKRKGSPAVNEFSWRPAKTVDPPPVDTSLIKITANAKTICFLTAGLCLFKR